jgi:hypothetical protein
LSAASLPVVIASDQSNVPMTLGTTIAGEDINNDVLKTEERGNYFTITSATTTQVKGGVGFLYNLRVVGGTLGAVTVYDNTAGSGTPIVPTVTPLQGQLLVENVSFNTGLTIVTAAATIIVLSYR